MLEKRLAVTEFDKLRCLLKTVIEALRLERIRPLQITITGQSLVIIPADVDLGKDRGHYAAALRLDSEALG